MELKSYFNPTPGADNRLTVDVRLSTDAAPSAPFILLGTVKHEEPLDNLPGAQGTYRNHPIVSHIQERLYVQHGIQNMQNINIVYGGTYKPVSSVDIVHTSLVIKPGETIKFKIRILPEGAGLASGSFLEASNPDFITIIKDGMTTGEWEIGLEEAGHTTVKIGIANTPMMESFTVEARTSF